MEKLKRGKSLEFSGDASLYFTSGVVWEIPSHGIGLGLLVLSQNINRQCLTNCRHK